MSLYKIVLMLKRLINQFGYELLLLLITITIFTYHFNNFKNFYFDEFHYIPAAKDMIAHLTFSNLEHPPLGKILLSWSVYFWGDNPLGWRFPTLLAGIISVLLYFKIALSLFENRLTAFLIGILALTNFWIFIQARIAMLDIFLLLFLLLGIYFFIISIKEKRKVFDYLCFISFGLATASKWNAIFIYFPTIIFFFFHNKKIIYTLKLVLISMLVYFICFYPIYVSTKLNYSIFSIIFDLPFEMLKLQRSVTADHPYKSKWYTWPFMIRPIWYEFIRYNNGEKFRGVILLGNPVQMIVGAFSLILISIQIYFKKIDKWQFYFLIGFLLSWLVWALVPRGLQFFYYFFIPGCLYVFLIPLSVQKIMENQKLNYLLLAICLISIAFFIYFYPIISGELTLESKRMQWAWLDTWI